MPSRVGDGIPCAPVERAVGDACRSLDEIDKVRAIVAAAVQQRRCTVESLTRDVADGPMRGSALMRETVGEALAGVRSAAEGQGRSVLRRARLPKRSGMSIFTTKQANGSAVPTLGGPMQGQRWRSIPANGISIPQAGKGPWSATHE